MNKATVLLCGEWPNALKIFLFPPCVRGETNLNQCNSPTPLMWKEWPNALLDFLLPPAYGGGKQI